MAGWSARLSGEFEAWLEWRKPGGRGVICHSLLPSVARAAVMDAYRVGFNTVSRSRVVFLITMTTFCA